MSVLDVVRIAPLICFSIIASLSIDYDIFLLCSIHEYRFLRLCPDRDSLLKAMRRTGLVVTSAGGVSLPCAKHGFHRPDHVLCLRRALLFEGLRLEPSRMASRDGSALRHFHCSDCLHPICNLSVENLHVVASPTSTRQRHFSPRALAARRLPASETPSAPISPLNWICNFAHRSPSDA